MALDAFSIIVAAYLAFFIHAVFFIPEDVEPMSTTTFTTAVLLVMFANNYIMGRSNLYSDLRPSSRFALIAVVFKSLFIDFAILGASVYLLRLADFSRYFMIFFGLLSFVFIIVEKLLMEFYISKLSKRSFSVRKILVIGNLERGQMVADLLEKQLSWGHEIIGRLTTEKTSNDSLYSLGHIDELPFILRDHPIDEVVFAVDGNRAVNIASHLNHCKQVGVPARILPALWQPGEHSITVDQCHNVPFLTIPVGNFNATGLMYKRILDIIGGLTGTILFLLVYPFVAVAIKLDSPGPILFKQKRVGQHGRTFILLKFRSMVSDAEAKQAELSDKNLMQGSIFKMENDPRITKVGKFLRKSSLDEFPQFLNVLRGEMSLVGTRPPTIEEMEKYDPWQYKRLSGKPGITGLWQVSGRNKITDFNQIVDLDCQYLERWRFLDDLKILFQTIYIVIRRKGAF